MSQTVGRLCEVCGTRTATRLVEVAGYFGQRTCVDCALLVEATWKDQASVWVWKLDQIEQAKAVAP